jgi:hypothetical protein
LKTTRPGGYEGIGGIMKKKVIRAVKTGIISVIVLVFMIGAFFGAVLQESYRLSPPTPEEVATDVVVRGGE